MDRISRRLSDLELYTILKRYLDKNNIDVYAQNKILICHPTNKIFVWKLLADLIRQGILCTRVYEHHVHLLELRILYETSFVYLRRNRSSGRLGLQGRDCCWAANSTAPPCI